MKKLLTLKQLATLETNARLRSLRWVGDKVEVDLQYGFFPRKPPDVKAQMRLGARFETCRDPKPHGMTQNEIGIVPGRFTRKAVLAFVPLSPRTMFKIMRDLGIDTTRRHYWAEPDRESVKGLTREEVAKILRAAYQVLERMLLRDPSKALSWRPDEPRRRIRPRRASSRLPCNIGPADPDSRPSQRTETHRARTLGTETPAPVLELPAVWPPPRSLDSSEDDTT